MHNLQISFLVLSIIGEFISALCAHSVSFVLNAYFSKSNVNVSALIICSSTLQFQQINKGKLSPFLLMFVFGNSTPSVYLVFFRVLCFVLILEELQQPSKLL